MKLRLPLFLASALLACYATVSQVSMAYDLEPSNTLSFSSTEDFETKTSDEDINATGGTLQWLEAIDLSPKLGKIGGTSIIFDTQTFDVVFGTSGAFLSENMTITKVGDGTLRINERITNSQNYVIQGGVLEMAHNGTDGTLNGTAHVMNGGTLRMSANNANGWGSDYAKLSTITVDAGGFLDIAGAEIPLGRMTIDLNGGSIIGTGSFNFNGDDFTLRAIADSLVSVNLVELRSESNQFEVTGSNTMTVSSLIGVSNHSTAPSLTMVKNGSGTLLITNDNDLPDTVGVQVNDGTLQLGDGGDTGYLGGISGIQINAGARLVVNRRNTTQLGYAMTGDGSLEVTGTGTTEILSANTYTGGTKVSNGTLLIGNGAYMGSVVGDVEVEAGANLVYNRSDTNRLNNITGGGNVVLQGGGFYSLGASFAHTGMTEIVLNAVLTLDDSTLGSFGSALTLSGGMLSIVNDVISSGSFNGLTLGGGIQSYINSISFIDTTLDVGNITENGSLLFTRMQAGTIRLFTTSAENEIDLTKYIFLDSSGFYAAEYNAGFIQQAATVMAELMASGNMPTAVYTSTKNLILAENVTVAAIMARVSSDVTLDLGSHNLTVTGTYTQMDGVGGYTITGTGTVSADSLTTNGRFNQDVDIQVGVNGGSLGILGTYAIADGKTLALVGTGEHIISGTLTGSGTIDIQSDGVLTIGGNNDGFTGVINLNSGRVLALATGGIGNAVVNFLGGTMQWAAGSTVDVSATLNGKATGTDLIFDTNDNSVTFATSMTLAGNDSGIAVNIRKVGTGTLSIGAVVSNPATVTVEEGTLQLSGGGGGSGTFRNTEITVLNGATLSLTGGDVLGYNNSDDIVKKLTINEGGILSLSVAGNQTLGFTDFQFQGARITGSSTANLLSTHITTLASSITTVIEIPELQLRPAQRDNIFTVARQAGAADSYVDLLVSSNLTTYGSDNFTDYSFIKTGAGVMALAGSNSFKTNVKIQEGTLMIGNGGATGTPGAVTGNDDVVFTVDISAGATLAFNRSDSYTANNVITGSGAIALKGAGDLTLGGDNSAYSGVITIDQGNKLIVNHNNALGSGTLELTNGTLDLNGMDATGNINLKDNGVLLNASAKTSGVVDIDQTNIGDINLGGLNGSRLGTINLALPAVSTDAVSRITGLSGSVNIASKTTLGVQSSMIADDATGGTAGAIFDVTGAGSVTLGDVSLALTDAAAVKFIDAAGVNSQYVHFSNVAATVTGTVDFLSPYSLLNYFFIEVVDSANGWVELKTDTSGSNYLIINSDETYTVDNKTSPLLEKFEGIHNNGTLDINSIDGGSLDLKALEGASSNAVVDTSDLTNSDTIRFVDNGKSDEMAGLYQGSVIGNAQIVKAGDSAYELTINGTVQTPHLDVQSGNLTLGGSTDIDDANVDAGATLAITSSNASIDNNLNVDGNLTLAPDARLTTETFTGAGTISLGDRSILTLNQVSTPFEASATGSGTLSIQNGAFSLGTTGSLSGETVLQLGSGASYTMSGDPAKDVMGGLDGSGTLILTDGTLQLQGKGGTFTGPIQQNGTATEINYSGYGTQTFNGAGDASIDMVQSGSGKLVLMNDSGDMTYANIDAVSGTLEIGSNLTASNINATGADVILDGEINARNVSLSNSNTQLNQAMATDDLQVSGGSLALNNNVTSSNLTIDNGARVSFNAVGTSGSAISTINTGDLTLGAGTLSAFLASNQTGVSQPSLITATGSIVIPTTGTLAFAVQGVGSATSWTDTTYEINLLDTGIDMSGGTYEFVLNDLLKNLGYSVSNVNYSNGISITLLSTNENLFLQYANSHNTNQAAQILWNNIGSVASGGMLDSILTSLLASGATPEQMTESLASFAGSSVTTMLSATRDEVYQQVRGIRNRVTQMGLNDSCQYNELPYISSWVQANGGSNRVDRSGDKAGYTLDTWGGTLGTDMNLSERWTVGAAFTANHSKLKTKAFDHATGDTDTYYANLFARLQVKRWAHAVILTGAWHDMELKRNVNIHGMNSINTKGDTNGTTFGGYYEGTYDFMLNEEKTTILQPLVNVSLYKTCVDSYTETGAGDASMRVNDLDATYGRVGIGARLMGVIGSSLLGREAYGELRVVGVQDIGDKTNTAHLSPVGIAGSSMSVKGSKAGRTGIQIGGGIALPVGGQGTIYADVDADFRSRATDLSGNIGYRYKF